jgi:hypothetical protein
MRALLSVGAAKVQRPEFDDLAEFSARRVTASAAGWGELDQLVQLAVDHIPALSAAGPMVERIWEHDRDSIWAFRRNDAIVGAYAMLFLNRVGLRRLLAGQFDASEPSLAWLARPGERVTAIYKWAVVAPGLASEGIRLVSRHLRSPRFADADLYALSTSEPATRLMLNLGFRSMSKADPRLLCYLRKTNRLGRGLVAA